MSVFDQLKYRLNLGRVKYGHGVRVSDDPRTWGTVKNSWFEMANEEFLDGIIYVVADYIRNCEDPRAPDCPDDNDRIIHFIHNPSLVQSVKHRRIVLLLKQLIEDCSYNN